MPESHIGRILVLGDEPDVAEALEVSLTRANYAARATTSPEEALKLLARRSLYRLIEKYQLEAGKHHD